MEEIDYFLAGHDREHVLTVLLDGTPQQSIPPQLLHTSDDAAVEPLAANLVADTKRKRMHMLRGEFLRLVAVMLGCSYDALRQRARQYRQTQRLAALAGVLAVSLLFTAVLLDRNAQIQTQFEQAQRNESQMLALLSGQALGIGDRPAALRYALSALGGGQGERPYMPQAELALTNALYAYTDTALRPQVRIAQPLAIEQIASGDVHITLDWAGMARGFSAQDGSLLWQQVVSPDVQTFYHLTSLPAAVFVDAKPRVAAVSAHNGQMLWTYQPSAYVIAGTAVSGDQTRIAIFYESMDELGTCLVDVLSLKDGKKELSVSFPLEGAYSDEMNGCFSANGRLLAIQTLFYETEPPASRYTCIDLALGKVVAFIPAQDESFLLHQADIGGQNVSFPQTPADFYAETLDEPADSRVLLTALGDTSGRRLTGLTSQLTACYPLHGGREILEISRQNYNARLRILDAESGSVLREFSVKLGTRHATQKIAGVTGDGAYAVIGGDMISLTDGSVIRLDEGTDAPLHIAHSPTGPDGMLTAGVVNAATEGEPFFLRRWRDGTEIEPVFCPYESAPYSARSSILLSAGSGGMIALSLHGSAVTRDMTGIAFYLPQTDAWTRYPCASKHEEMPQIALAQDSPLCALLGYGGTLELIDAQTGQTRWSVETGFAGYLIEEVRFCADDRFIFLYAHDQVMLYDAAAGAQIAAYSGFTGRSTVPFPRVTFSLYHDRASDSLFVGCHECLYEASVDSTESGLRIDLATGEIRTVISGFCCYLEQENRLLRRARTDTQDAWMIHPCYSTAELIRQAQDQLGLTDD